MAIPVSWLPSPINVAAVTFPVTTTFPEATRDVSAFVNWTVVLVVLPSCVAFSKDVRTPTKLLPSPRNSVAVMIPVSPSRTIFEPTPTFDSTYAFPFTCKLASGSAVVIPTLLFKVSTNR